MWTTWEFHSRPNLNELPSTKMSPIRSVLLNINNSNIFMKRLAGGLLAVDLPHLEIRRTKTYCVALEWTKRKTKKGWNSDDRLRVSYLQFSLTNPPKSLFLRYSQLSIRDLLITCVDLEWKRRITRKVKTVTIYLAWWELLGKNATGNQNFCKNILWKKTATCLMKIPSPSNEIASLNPQPPVNVIRNVNITYPRLNFCMDQWTGEKCYDSSGFKYIRTKTTTGKLTSNQKSRSLF